MDNDAPLYPLAGEYGVLDGYDAFDVAGRYHAVVGLAQGVEQLAGIAVFLFKEGKEAVGPLHVGLGSLQKNVHFAAHEEQRVEQRAQQ